MPRFFADRENINDNWAVKYIDNELILNMPSSKADRKKMELTGR